jgi:signal transduction histidine kinase
VAPPSVVAHVVEMSPTRAPDKVGHPASADALLAAMLGWPKRLVLVATLILVAGIGWGDYLTGWELDFTPAYVVPMILVAWTMDRRVGLAVAVLCALAWWSARIADHPYQTDWGLTLALLVRLLFLLVVVIAVAAVKAQWELGQARIVMLEQMRTLEGELLLSREEERQRIGRDLHDGLCQTLAGIAALSSALSRKLASRSEPDASGVAAEISRLLNDATGEARDLARGLGNAGMPEADLAGALRNLALKVNVQFSISCTVTGDDIPARLEAVNALHLFRIAQEAVNNAVAHGRANRVEISLGQSGDEGFLTVQDNGAGLSDAALRGDGIGLRTMNDRAQLIGGNVDVRPQTGGGTKVTCIFPLSDCRESRAPSP